MTEPYASHDASEIELKVYSKMCNIKHQNKARQCRMPTTTGPSQQGKTHKTAIFNMKHICPGTCWAANVDVTHLFVLPVTAARLVNFTV